MIPAEEQLAAFFDEAKHKALALLHAERQRREDSATGEPITEWMTDTELARYWRLLKDGEPVTAGIRSWVKRLLEEHPLPHAYMGDLLRFKREDVDRWAVEEAERRRAEASRKKLRASR
jgi:excisionase family DNA binding protein